MQKFARSIAVAVTVLATAIGTAAFVSSASSASITTAHPRTHLAKPASTGQNCNPTDTYCGKFTNNMTQNNLSMRVGPGTNLPIISPPIASSNDAISDYCFVVGLNGQFWDIVFDPLTDRAGFVPEAFLKNTQQELKC